MTMKINMKIDRDFHQKLSLLKIYYACILNLLDNFCSGYVVRLNEQINKVYLILINEVELILQDKNFSELLKDYERPFESLLGKEAREANLYWKDGFLGDKNRDFYSKIEENFIKINKEPFPIEVLPNSSKIKKDLKMVDETIELLKDKTKEDKTKIEKVVTELKAKIQLEEFENESINKDLKVEFIDNEAIIKVGNKKCQLPAYKNEHFFCRAAFEHQVEEVIDWSEIYEKITGYYEGYYGKPTDKRESWRIVYDTAEALNKRIKDGLGIDKLFVWQEKTVKRTQ